MSRNGPLGTLSPATRAREKATSKDALPSDGKDKEVSTPNGWKTRRPRVSSSSELYRRARGPIYRGKQGRSRPPVQGPHLRSSFLLAPCSGLRARPCLYSPLQDDVARVPSVCARRVRVKLVNQMRARSSLSEPETAPIWFFSHVSEPDGNYRKLPEPDRARKQIGFWAVF
ncbi:hypothetical protein BHE74_00014000 [Ensete ventricosum]|nr:hypothetical protein GW17_00039275 [Ensete ventricosum]RWW77806.1 hypothetical protein BHE74_00014000 [Ensete ventricosum]RZS03204.1 hypothetical protein BHM03_00033350 [Ensete ventricosum]